MVSVRIPLNENKFAWVSIQDAERVMAHSWNPMRGRRSHTLYATTRINKKTIYLHRFILDVGDKRQVDHINLDGLDCVRSNLRVATPSQNNQNKEKHPNNTSGYKGVYWSRVRSKWMAYISKDKKRINLGYYTDLIHAARVYDQAARELHGEFARLNFPDESVTVETSTTGRWPKPLTSI